MVVWVGDAGRSSSFLQQLPTMADRYADQPWQLAPSAPIPHLIHGQGEWNERDPAKRIPNPLRPGLLRFAKGVICAVLWMKLSAPYGAGECGQQPWRLCVWRRLLPAVVLLEVRRATMGAAGACAVALLPTASLPSTPHPCYSDLLEGRWFQHEASLVQRFFFLWLVGLAARCKY